MAKRLVVEIDVGDGEHQDIHAAVVRLGVVVQMLNILNQENAPGWKSRPYKYIVGDKLVATFELQESSF